MKFCSRCRVEKPKDQFSRHAGRPDGLQWSCKACQAAVSAERYRRDLEVSRARSRAVAKRWADAHPGARTDAARRVTLLKLYGITVGQYDEMLAEQDGLCWICRQPDSMGRRLATDHHDGHVRGLLCGKCNRGLGNFADDPERLERAAEYLRRALLLLELAASR